MTRDNVERVQVRMKAGNVAMLMTGRLFGAFPLLKKRKNFQLSYIWLAYSLAVLSLQNAYAVYKISTVLSTPNVKLYHATLSAGLYINTTAIVYAGLFVVLTSRRKMDVFHRNISQAQQTMSKNLKRRKTDNSREKVALYMSTYLMAIFVVQFLVRGVEPTLKVFLKDFGSMSCHLGVIGSVSVFTTFVGMIEGELHALNELLMESSANPGRRLRIALMSDVHYLMSTTAEDLNSVFCLSYFTIIFGSAWSETTVINRTAYNFWTTKDYFEGALQFMWVVFWFIIIFATVIPCSSAVYYSKKFNHKLSFMIIQKLNSKDLFGEDKGKLKLHVDFDFTVCFKCRFFQLDRTLIHSMVRNVTGFAVILAQIAILQGA